MSDDHPVAVAVLIFFASVGVILTLTKLLDVLAYLAH